MKALIRPILFTLARLGLFFALTIWGTSQWWCGQLYVECLSGEVTEHGCVFWLYTDGKGFMSESYSASRWDRKWLFEYPASDPPLIGGPGDGFTFAGTTIQQGPLGYSISLAHWLIVTVFALFYGVLKWVYRKQPEVADE